MFLLATCLAVAAALAQADEDEWGQDPAAPALSAPRTLSSPAQTPLPVPVTAASRQAQALKEKANLLYRAKKFAEAGRLYRKAADSDSMDATARNYLGLCYLKLGFKDSALAAEREALLIADRRLAAGDTAEWSFADLRARKSAYFNLDKLGGPMPEPKAGQCETWSSFSACGARLHVCAESGRRPEAGGTLHWDVLRVGLTRARALFSYEEVEAPSQVPHPEMRDMEELSVEGVPESKLRWVNRDSSLTLPLGDMLETADSACGKNCGNLEKPLSECRVIHFDPCAGVVGVACGIQEEGESKDRILIGEYYLVPAK